MSAAPAPSLALAERNCAEAHARYESRIAHERALWQGDKSRVWTSVRPTRAYQLPTENIDFPHAFRLIPTLNFAIGLLQDLTAALELKFYITDARGEKIEIERQPGNIVDLWKIANTEETGLEMTAQLVGDLLIQGNAYLFLSMLGTQKMQEFWMLDPILVTPIPFEKNGRIVKHYEYKTGPGDPEIIPREQIVHFRGFNPARGLVGLSPLQALVLQYETDRDSARFQRLFYGKGGSVAGHYSTEFALEDDDRKVLEDSLRNRYAGPQNAWEPVLLPRSLKYERAGLTFEEMNFLETRIGGAREMLMVYRVHPMLAGIMDGAGGLNSDVAGVVDRWTYQHGVIPRAKNICATLDENLLARGMFGRNVTCEFDVSGVLPFQEIRLKRAQGLALLTGGPFMTRAEAREEIQLEDLKDSELEKMLEPLGMLTADEKDEQAEVAAAASVPASEGAKGSAERRSHLETRDTKRRDRLRVRADRSRRPHERRMERGFRRIFARQRSRAKAELEAQTSRGAEAEGLQHGGPQRSDEAGWGLGLAHLRAIDIDALLRDEDADRTLIERLIRAIVEEQGTQALADLGLAIAFDSAKRDVREWIQEKALRSLTNVNDTTREALRASLLENVSGGETFGELVAKLDEVFDARRARAPMIARTETTPAYNFATVTAWEQSGVVEGKEWLSSHDEAVRDAHQQLDGQVVPLDGFFEVDGQRAEFPGTFGVAELDINCRCTTVAVLTPVAEATQEKMPRAIAERLSFRQAWEKASKPSTNGHTKPSPELEKFLASLVGAK